MLRRRASLSVIEGRVVADIACLNQAAPLCLPAAGGACGSDGVRRLRWMGSATDKGETAMTAISKVVFLLAISAALTLGLAGRVFAESGDNPE